jgi:hypothetical protein
VLAWMVLEVGVCVPGDGNGVVHVPALYLMR